MNQNIADCIVRCSIVVGIMTLSGCVAPVVTSLTGSRTRTVVTSAATEQASTEVLKAGLEDRTTFDQARDVKIRAAIVSGLLNEGVGLLKDVGTDVWEQRVLLTGSVETEEAKIKAGQIAAGVEQVEVVHNEIQVTSASGGASGIVNDTVVETKIKAKLLAAGGVNSLNYRWRSVNGRVYFIGRALNTEEHEKVKNIATGTEDVREVISRIEVRPKKAGEKPLLPEKAS